MHFSMGLLWPRPFLHLSPEPLESPGPFSLPWARPPSQLACEQALAAAERFAQLHPVIALTLGRVGAEFELAAWRTIRSRSGDHRGRGGPIRGEPLTVSGKTRRQRIAVGASQPSLAIAWPVPTLGQVQQQKHIGHELLGSLIERRPPR
jgi:hypothetical protein